MRAWSCRKTRHQVRMCEVTIKGGIFCTTCNFVALIHQVHNFQLRTQYFLIMINIWSNACGPCVCYLIKSTVRQQSIFSIYAYKFCHTNRIIFFFFGCRDGWWRWGLFLFMRNIISINVVFCNPKKHINLTVFFTLCLLQPNQIPKLLRNCPNAWNFSFSFLTFVCTFLHRQLSTQNKY